MEGGEAHDRQDPDQGRYDRLGRLKGNALNKEVMSMTVKTQLKAGNIVWGT
jgi:hypothetical protein